MQTVRSSDCASNAANRCCSSITELRQVKAVYKHPPSLSKLNVLKTAIMPEAHDAHASSRAAEDLPGSHNAPNRSSTIRRLLAKQGLPARRMSPGRCQGLLEICCTNIGACIARTIRDRGRFCRHLLLLLLCAVDSREATALQRERRCLKTGNYAGISDAWLRDDRSRELCHTAHQRCRDEPSQIYKKGINIGICAVALQGKAVLSGCIACSFAYLICSGRFKGAP